jgi:hypothetical protein
VYKPKPALAAILSSHEPPEAGPEISISVTKKPIV